MIKNCFLFMVLFFAVFSSFSLEILDENGEKRLLIISEHGGKKGVRVSLGDVSFDMRFRECVSLSEEYVPDLHIDIVEYDYGSFSITRPVCGKTAPQKCKPVHYILRDLEVSDPHDYWARQRRKRVLSGEQIVKRRSKNCTDIVEKINTLRV